MKRRSKKLPPAVDGARWVPLTKGKFALVDAAVYETVMTNGPWHLYTPSKGRGKRRRCTDYARRVFYESGGRRRSMYLHRWLWEVVWQKPYTPHVDHKDGDGLDCRHNKLRRATHDQNQHNRLVKNSTGYCGVKAVGARFSARIYKDGARAALGTFDTAKQAAKAYDDAAKALRGEFAKTNITA